MRGESLGNRQGEASCCWGLPWRWRRAPTDRGRSWNSFCRWVRPSDASSEPRIYILLRWWPAIYFRFTWQNKKLRRHLAETLIPHWYRKLNLPLCPTETWFKLCHLKGWRPSPADALISGGSKDAQSGGEGSCSMNGDFILYHKKALKNQFDGFTESSPRFEGFPAKRSGGFFLSLASACVPYATPTCTAVSVLSTL